jgi:hypothetical protein
VCTGERELTAVVCVRAALAQTVATLRPAGAQPFCRAVTATLHRRQFRATAASRCRRGIGDPNETTDTTLTTPPPPS